MKIKIMTAVLAIGALLLAGSGDDPKAQSAADRGAEKESPSGPHRVRIGWAVMQAKLLHKKLPEYPKEARDKRIEGAVQLDIFVGKDGAVEEVKVLSGEPLLAGPIADEVKQWQFVPTLLNREPIEVVSEMDLEFHLRGAQATVTAMPAHPRRIKR